MLKEGKNRIRAGNFKKVTEIRQAGFKKSIHALPPQVKLRINKKVLKKLNLK